jgi:hypothetical protein
MNVIGHHHPGVKFIKPPRRLAVQNSVGHYACHPGIREPERARSRNVEPFVLRQESSRTLWDRPRQPPCHKGDRLFWNPMRQVSARKGHLKAILRKLTDHKKRWSVLRVVPPPKPISQEMDQPRSGTIRTGALSDQKRPEPNR